ncbi:hypothetical protein [Actinoplanes rectilineatus]|uniref:CdiA C-terminal domain-containing protein n=1 Tax=Actinoplanes rectilineatus TaxID=113571 RepID=UPI00069842FD|nr:hypothetical protein [Actinoplanes rectilineatus]
MTAPVPLLDDATLIADGIRNGSWVDVSLGGLGASLDGLSLVVDPLGTVAAWGVAWLLDHVEPLRETLDRLAGDAPAVAAQATTWHSVAASVASTRTAYADRVTTQLAEWHGASADAYRRHAAENLAVLDGISVASGGIGAAVEGAGLVVALVRGLVRDLIAEFVATLAVRLPTWAAAEGLTLGAATPFVVSRVAALVSEWAGRIRRLVQSLLDSLRHLTSRITGLEKILDQLRMKADDLSRSADTPAGTSGGGTAFTPPSMPPGPGRRPRGDRTEAHPTKDTHRGLRRENESADVLVQHGYDVEQNPPTKANGTNPDYRIEGEYFDCYAPTSGNADKIRNKLSEKVSEGQASRLVLNLTDTSRTMEEVAAVLRRKPITGLEEILVVKDGRVTRFYPFTE